MPMRLSSVHVADRMRLYRRRRRLGLRPLIVEIHPMEIEGLVKRAYIKPDDRDDWSKVQIAVRKFLSDLLRAPERQ